MYIYQYTSCFNVVRKNNLLTFICWYFFNHWIKLIYPVTGFFQLGSAFIELLFLDFIPCVIRLTWLEWVLNNFLCLFEGFCHGLHWKNMEHPLNICAVAEIEKSKTIRRNTLFHYEQITNVSYYYTWACELL